MTQIIVRKTKVFKFSADHQDVIPYRDIYVYPRGRRDTLEVEVNQSQRWYDDRRWKAPTLNWCAAVGGHLTIAQAEAFRDALNVAIEQAKMLAEER